MIGAGETAAAVERASALCDLGRFDEATAALRRLATSTPENVRVFCLLARAEIGAGDSQAARAAADVAVGLAPDMEWPHRLLSIAHSSLGQHDAAIAHAREAIRCDTGEMRGQMRLAQALLAGEQDLDEADAAAAQAVALAPAAAEAHLVVGSVAAAKGERADAEAAFRRALAIDPDNAAAHNELARLHLKRRTLGNPGGLAQAAGGFATALRADPRAAVSRRNLDLVIRIFLGRAAYFIFLAAYIGGRLSAGSGQVGTRLIPLGLLVLPAAFAWRFVGRLTPDLRGYVYGTIRREAKLCLVAALEALAGAAIVIGVFAPQTARPPLAAVAGVAALVGRLILKFTRRRAKPDAT